VVASWFEFALGRSPGDEDASTLAWIESRLTAPAGDNVRELVLSLAESDAVRFRRAARP
jgi:hypothetical protein